MIKRRSRSKLQMAALLKQFNSQCHICGCEIKQGESWQAEHIIPLALGGEDGGSNYRPAHAKCHAIKTAKDVAAIAKAKRVEANHLGAKPQDRVKIPTKAKAQTESRHAWAPKLQSRLYGSE